MRVQAIILILLMTAIAAHSQDYHPSPAYYPIDVEILTDYSLSGPQINLSGYLDEIPQPYQRPTFWQKNGRPIAIIAWHIGTVAAGAIGDALYDTGNKNWGKVLQATEIGMAMTGGFVHRIKGTHEWVNYIASYVMIRASLFDPLYNKAAGHPVWYVGTVSDWDNIWSKMNPPPEGRWIFSTITLTIGIAVPLKELKKTRVHSYGP